MQDYPDIFWQGSDGVARGGGMGWPGVEALLTWTQPSYFDLQFPSEKWSADVDKTHSPSVDYLSQKENNNIKYSLTTHEY